MPTRSVNLTEHSDQFIEDGIASGRFKSASEVVDESLRLLERRDHAEKARNEWLRAETQGAMESLDRGEGIEFETMDDFDAFLDQIGEEVSAEVASERGCG